jgi:hypothetical protein
VYQRSAELSTKLRTVLAAETPYLTSITDSQADLRPGGGPGWNRKQELGHLLDSATNNRVRFVVAAVAGSYTGPTYNPDGWVEAGGYVKCQWAHLIESWQSNNQLLALVVERMEDRVLDAECTVGGHKVSLDFLIDDYILHMRHHLDHLLGREKITAYPGASVGV